MLLARPGACNPRARCLPIPVVLVEHSERPLPAPPAGALPHAASSIDVGEAQEVSFAKSV